MRTHMGWRECAPPAPVPHFERRLGQEGVLPLHDLVADVAYDVEGGGMSAMAAACAGPVTAPRSQACTAPMKRRAPRRDPTRGSVDVVHRDRREQLRTSYRREATATRGDKAGGGESRHGRRPGGPPNPHRHERDHEGHPPGGEHPTGGATKKTPPTEGHPPHERGPSDPGATHRAGRDTRPKERATQPASPTRTGERHPTAARDREGRGGAAPPPGGRSHHMWGKSPVR